jgi:tRNA A37 threonylcarbamoyladenosine dehydratase
LQSAAVFAIIYDEAKGSFSEASEECAMTKVTIIGAGSVGSTIAYTLAVQGIASEIVMIDINGEACYRNSY